MRARTIPSLLILSAVVITSAAAATVISAPWTTVSAYQVTQPVPTPPSDAEARAFADKLIAKMTLAEKLGQMTQVPLNSPPPRPADELVRTGAVGSFLFITDAAEINRLST